MTQPSSPLFPGIELFRKLSAKALAGSEEMIVWQIDQTQEFVARSSRQLHDSLATAGTVKKLEDWPAAVGEGLRNVLELGREYAISASDYQRETCSLWQRQAMDSQKLLTESLNGQFSMLQPSGAAQKHHSKHGSDLHRVAA